MERYEFKRVKEVTDVYIESYEKIDRLVQQLAQEQKQLQTATIDMLHLLNKAEVKV